MLWTGLLLLPDTGDDLPPQGQMAWLHTPAGIDTVHITAVQRTPDGVNVEVEGFGACPPMTMASLQWELPP